MWGIENSVTCVGWIDDIDTEADASGVTISILLSSYHEHYLTAKRARHGTLLVPVFVPDGNLADECKSHLKVGDRIQIYGRLSSRFELSSIHTTEPIIIEALRVERAEKLESFRFVNHAWNYELKPSTTQAVGSS